MHSCDLNISISKLSKIEGHADLDIKIKNGEVKDVSLRVMENVRFFNQAVEGMAYDNVPTLVSHICGTCSIAHLTGCTEAIEKALGIVPSPLTITMRKLTMHSLMIRDHALHLYFFVMPDLFGVDSAIDFPDDKKELIHEALHIKEAGNNLSNLIAGRSVHPLFEKIGGFLRIPEKEKISPMIEELKNIRPSVLKLVDIFYNCSWELKRKTNFVALTSNDFSYLEGKIKSSNGIIIEESNFWDHLHNVVMPYSQAAGFKFEGQEYMVGSLARLNLNKESLHSNTKRDAYKYLEVFPSNNIYHNNLAQAIEILHSIDHSIELLENTEFIPEEPVKPSKMSGEGVGVIEAPRGILYYWTGINNGKIRYVNLIIPTAQNLVNMREDVKQIVIEALRNSPEDITKKELKLKTKKEIEKLIRAYDPCMSCASHFLKINWI